jgi:hypothetical protein
VLVDLVLLADYNAARTPSNKSSNTLASSPPLKRPNATWPQKKPAATQRVAVGMDYTRKTGKSLPRAITAVRMVYRYLRCATREKA